MNVEGFQSAANESPEENHRRACVEAVRVYRSKRVPAVKDAVLALQAISELSGMIPHLVSEQEDLGDVPAFVHEIAPQILSTGREVLYRLAYFVLDGRGFSRFAQSDWTYYVPLVFDLLGADERRFLITFVMKKAGLGYCMTRIPCDQKNLMLRCVTDRHGRAVLDMRRWSPRQVIQLSEGVCFYKRDKGPTELIVKYCMWLTKSELGDKDPQWPQMTLSLFKLILSMPVLVSLTFEDCNLDRIRVHIPTGLKSLLNLDAGREPFDRLTKLEFKVSEHNLSKRRPWGEMRPLLQWMLPMPNLQSLTLPPAVNAQESGCNQLGTMLAQLSKLTHVHMTSADKNSLTYPSSQRCEATQYGRAIQKLGQVESLVMMNATPAAICGWSCLTRLTYLEIGIAPVQFTYFCACLRQCIALEGLSLKLATPLVKRKPFLDRNKKEKKRPGGSGRTIPVGPPLRVTKDSHGNMVPNCGWCGCHEEYFEVLAEMLRLKTLRTSVHCAARCCKYHLDRLNELTELRELNFHASSELLSKHDDRLNLPDLTSLQHMTVNIPAKPSVHEIKKLPRLTGLTHLDFCCVLGENTQLFSAFKSEVAEANKNTAVGEKMMNLRIKDIRQTGSLVYGCGGGLPDVGSSQLDTYVRACTGLRSLYLPHNTGVGQDNVLKQLSKLVHLTALHNICTAIDDMNTAYFELPTQLERLTLNCGRNLNQFVTWELEKCKRLRYLKVRIVEKMNPDGIEYMCETIGQLGELRELCWVGRYVSNNCHDMWVRSEAVLDVMGEALSKLAKKDVLHTLDLYKFPLLKPGHRFAEAIGELKSLETLLLKRCSISHAMYDSLGKAFSKNPTRVKRLYLGRVIDAVIQPDKLSSLISGFPHLHEVDYSLVLSGSVLIFMNKPGKEVFQVTDPVKIGTIMIRSVKRMFSKVGVHAMNAGRGTLVSKYTVDDAEPEDKLDSEIELDLMRRAEIDLAAEEHIWLQPELIEAACQALERG